MSGCSAAASDHDFGPLTTTSTNRTARSSLRSRPRGSPVSGSTPATQVSYPSPARAASSRTRPSGGGEAAGEPGALGEVVVIGPAVAGLQIGRAAAGDATYTFIPPCIINATQQ